MDASMQWIFDVISIHGLAIVLLVMFLIYGRKFLNNVLDRYCKELDKKDITINNHLDHVNQTLHSVSTQTVLNKESLDRGFDRVVEAINTQTKILGKRDKED